MKITFLSPFPNLSGGQRVVAIYAQALEARGHCVEVVCSRPRPRSWVRDAKDLLKGRGLPPKPDSRESHYENYGVNYRVVDHLGPIGDADVSAGDVVIATWWETAHWAAALGSERGRRVYFVQHHEVHRHLPQVETRETYRLPMPKVCVSDWLARIMREEYGDQHPLTVSNAVDVDHFRAPLREKQGRLAIGLMWGGTGFKGSDIALEAIRLAKQEVEFTVHSFGHRRPTDQSIPFHLIDRFEASPAQRRIPQIYASCDAWLFSSRDEGFGLPILEAMACRTPVIGTPAGAAPELIGQGGGILVEPENPEDMARAIVEVARMSPVDWQAMSDAAYRTATSYTWEDATDRFEEALLAAVEGEWDAKYGPQQEPATSL